MWTRLQIDADKERGTIIGQAEPAPKSQEMCHACRVVAIAIKY